MTAAPATSVGIPVFNGEETLGDLLAALKTQAGVPGLFEIIVVDNGSTDRTTEITRAHGALLLHQPVRGPSAARNLGLARAQSDIVLFTDADTVPSRRWLASLLAAFEDPAPFMDGNRPRAPNGSPARIKDSPVSSPPNIRFTLLRME